MNDYEYEQMMKEQMRKLDLINREAWKYEPFYRSKMSISIKSLYSKLTRKLFRKQQPVPCCIS
ncbi:MULTISPECIES: hypothetical protein [Bacillaceae]|uniref:hypothetical protein n=1 Tax=Bacillaceae TaxID=186817 RepID=UPI001BDEF2BF|nr:MULTISPECIES: hypothetical protein [Bacillaceae]MDX8360730.1 hypothetical protein [Cytobacillus sp. IB215316]